MNRLIFAQKLISCVLIKVLERSNNLRSGFCIWGDFLIKASEVPFFKVKWGGLLRAQHLAYNSGRQGASAITSD
jgi:hypothetical protein